MGFWGLGVRVEGAPVHALPSAPVCPARHTQSLKSSLPSPELALAGHALHCKAWAAVITPGLKSLDFRLWGSEFGVANP